MYSDMTVLETDLFLSVIKGHFFFLLAMAIITSTVVLFWILSRTLINKRLDTHTARSIKPSHIIESFFLTCKDSLLTFLPSCFLISCLAILVIWKLPKNLGHVLNMSFEILALMLLFCSAIHRSLAPNHRNVRLINLQDRAAHVVSSIINSLIMLATVGIIANLVIAEIFPSMISLFNKTYVIIACVFMIIKIHYCQHDVRMWLSEVINPTNEELDPSSVVHTLHYVNTYWKQISILIIAISGLAWQIRKPTSPTLFIVELSLVITFFITCQYLMNFLISKKDALMIKYLSGTDDFKIKAYSRKLEMFVMAVFYVSMITAILKICGVNLFEVIEHYIFAKILIVSILGNVLAISAICLVYIAIELMIDIKLKEICKKRDPKDLHSRTVLPLVKSSLRVLVFIISGLIILSNLGVNITPLIAGFGMFGLAISLAAQDLVKSFIQGLVVLTENNFVVGDFVKVNECEGYVEDLTIRSMHLRATSGKLDIIPYGNISNYSNFSKDFKFNLFELQLDMAADLEKVSQIIKESSDIVSKEPVENIVIYEQAKILGVKSINGKDIILLWGIRTSPDPFNRIGLKMNKIISKKMVEANINVSVDDRYIHFDPETPMYLKLIEQNNKISK